MKNFCKGLASGMTWLSHHELTEADFMQDFHKTKRLKNPSTEEEELPMPQPLLKS